MTPRLSIQVTRRAAREIKRASVWWARNRADAPDAVAEEVERAFALLAVQPGIGARALNQRLPGVQRFYLNRIHYNLFYRVVLSADELHILGLWHASRGASPKL